MIFNQRGNGVQVHTEEGNAQTAKHEGLQQSFPEVLFEASKHAAFRQAAEMPSAV